MFDQVKHELNQLIPFIGIAVAKYPEFNRDEKCFSALNQELYRCQDVLNDLQELQKYYEDLPSQARIAWERTAIGASSLADMRTKIASSRQIFTMLNTEIIKCVSFRVSSLRFLLAVFTNPRLARLSQANTIRYISRWIKEYKNENKAASVISGLSTGVESLNDENTWTRIRQELEEIGMAPEAFERNKGLIHERLEKAISSGDLSDVFDAGSDLGNHRLKPSISSLSKAPSASSLYVNEDLSVERTQSARKKDRKVAGGTLPRPSAISRLAYRAMHRSNSLAEAAERGDVRSIRNRLRLGADPNDSGRSGPSAIWLAARNGHAEIIEILIEYGIDLSTNSAGFLALQSAAMWGHHKVVQLLLDAGVPPEDETLINFGPLFSAVSSNYEYIVKILIKCGSNVNIQGPEGRTAAMTAALHGHARILRLLLESGAKIDAMNSEKLTALDMACQRCNVEVVRLLLEEGAKINVSGLGSNTPLHLAVIYDTESQDHQQKQLETVSLLLEHGAASVINLINDKRETALLYALRRNNAELVKILLKHGADVKKRTAPGVIPLTLAAETNNASIVGMILDSGADPNEEDVDGETALLKAIKLKNPTIAQFLLEKGADVKTRKLGKSPLLMAAGTGDTTLVNLILQKSPNLSDIDNGGETALWKAVRSKNFTMTKLLLEKGADLNFRNKSETMLLEVVQGGNMAITLLLLQNGADPNIINNSGDFPLLDAVSSDKGHLATALLAHGADPNLRPDVNGADTALVRAVRGNNYPMAMLLLQKKAEIDLCGRGCDSALILACRLGYIQMIDALLEHGADINLTRNDGESALSVTTASGRVRNSKLTNILKLLLEKGADPNIKNSQGIPVIFSTIVPKAVHEAEGCLEILELLLSAGADPNSVDHEGVSLLAATVETGNVTFVELLIKKGADVHSTDGRYSCLMIAIERRSSQMIDLLLQRGATIDGYTKRNHLFRRYIMTDDDARRKSVDTVLAKHGISIGWSSGKYLSVVRRRRYA